VSAPWFVLWRVTPDPAKAQTVQVVQTAAALARTGRSVVLPVDGRAPDALLAALGVERPAGLRVLALGRGIGASIRLRAALIGFLAASRGEGIVACRHPRYADAALTWSRGRVRLLFEAHEIASREAASRGEDPGPWLDREARVLAGARWLVTNAPGTLSALRARHRRLPPAVVVHNAATPFAPARGDGVGVGIVGSVRPYKDPETVAAAARSLGGGVSWVGADPASAERLRAASGGALAVRGPVPHAAVPALLRTFHTLVLPLSPRDEFGEALTSPLKLWDALQSGVPLVAADTAAVRAAAEGAYVPYVPGDPASLAAAIRRAADPAVRAAARAEATRRARTWDDRARELLAAVS
jgi:glycosyltransferase involved in cell wall biosynthesis